MTEQVFASVWGLSYSDFEFLNRFGTKSRVAIACQLLYFRQYGRFPAARVELDPDVIAYVAEQIGTTDDLSYSFSSDTARRHRAGILDFLGFRRASDRDRANLQAWMIEQLGGQDLNLTDWIERGFDQARQMGVFVPSDKIMERLETWFPWANEPCMRGTHAVAVTANIINLYLGAGYEVVNSAPHI